MMFRRSVKRSSLELIFNVELHSDIRIISITRRYTVLKQITRTTCAGPVVCKDTLHSGEHRMDHRSRERHGCVRHKVQPIRKVIGCQLGGGRVRVEDAEVCGRGMLGVAGVTP